MYIRKLLANLTSDECFHFKNNSGSAAKSILVSPQKIKTLYTLHQCLQSIGIQWYI